MYRNRCDCRPLRHTHRV